MISIKTLIFTLSILPLPFSFRILTSKIEQDISIGKSSSFDAQNDKIKESSPLISSLPEQCSIDLIKSYVLTEETLPRESSKMTPIQSEYCSNMTQTCCLDEEFQQIFERTERNVQKVKTSGNLVALVIRSISELNNSQIDEIFEGVNDSFFENNNLSKEELRTLMIDIQLDQEEYFNRVLFGIRYILRYGSGIVCGFCVPSNHQSFIDFDTPDKTKIVINQEECSQMISDPDAIYFMNMIKDIETIFKITSILNEKYQINFDLDFSVFSEIESNSLKTSSDLCSKSNYFLKNTSKCMGVCKKLGFFNSNPLIKFVDAIALNFVFISDYAGPKKYLKEVLSPQETNENSINMLQLETSLSNNEIKSAQMSMDEQNIDTIENTFNRMKFLSSTVEYLEPIKNNKYNMRNMEIQSGKNEGWKLYNYGAYVFVQPNNVAKNISKILIFAFILVNFF